MTSERAREILRCMANGVDPITGEILEADHLCNSPEVIRAIFAAIQAMSGSEETNASTNDRKDGKLNAGRKWTQEDLDELKRMHQNGEPMEQICARLQRNERSVLKQLTRLGLRENANSSGRPITPGLERAGQRWTQEEDARLRALHAEKAPIERISERMQRSEYAIYCRMEKLQLFETECGYPPEETLPPLSNRDSQQLRKMFLEGTPVDELAACFERSEKSIRARLFYMGLSRESPLPPWRKNASVQASPALRSDGDEM